MSSLMNTYSRFQTAFVKGEGSLLWDDSGKSYIDFGSGISVTNLGHCNPSVTEAIRRQAGTLLHTSNIFTIKEQEELADLITANSFQGKVFFCNSGAEANEGAIKLARLYGNVKHGGARYKIISMYNSFHGRTYATLSATGQAKVQKGFTPTTGYNVYIPFNDMEELKKAASFGDTAAVILELFQGESGVLPADKEYIKQLRAYCSKNDIILIIDEVQTGYGRTGKMFAYSHYGIEPDVMTMAKAIANGLPMGAFLAKDEFAQYMTPGTHGSTFGGTPIVCAAAIAVIKEMTKPGFLDKVTEKGNILHSLIKDALGDACEIRGLGLLIGVKTKYEPRVLAEECLKNGLVVITAGNNSVRLYPPLTITEGELKEGALRFIKSVKNLEEKSK